LKYRTAGLIAAGLVAAVWGTYLTRPAPAGPSPAAGTETSPRVPSARDIVVDQASLRTAEDLARMPVTPEERTFAQDALRIADNDMDLAFASAVRRIANLPQDTASATKDADAHLQEALQTLAADQDHLKQLEKARAKLDSASGESLRDQINLANAQVALDQDEVDDARVDLRRAGGDPQGRMEELLAEHAAASRASDSVHITVVNPARDEGLVRHLQTLVVLAKKKRAVVAARRQADSTGGGLEMRHDLSEESKPERVRAAPNLSHDSARALLAETQRLGRETAIRATLDRRVENQHSLSAVYSGWVAVIAAQQRAAVNRALTSVTWILAIVLAAIIVIRVVSGVLDRSKRWAQPHHLAVRVAFQVVAALLIAFVIAGPPSNLGTMVGLVTAALTIALKDFIVGFVGWFVLLGKNGIRIGDLVEIRGVTGEVVELGVFRTVLLEMRAWTDSGNPTGRRVTFNNSFAIEGHYFNFSTSGRWLWDEIRIAVPAGRDAHAIAATLQKQVDEATAESVREAEAQWRAALGSRHPQAPLTGASVTLRPTAAGVEIVIRYVTRATEREEFRARIYKTALEMLEGAAAR